MALAELSDFPFERATTLDALRRLLAERSALRQETVLLAGGTDWIVERHMAAVAPFGVSRPLVVDVSRLAELRGISIAHDVVRIGAATTYLEIRRHPVLLERVPLLAAMARDVGAIQIQARGTLGGNLATASPAADGVAALAALDADVLLTGLRGERRVPLAGYFTGYKKSVRSADELIAAVEFRLPHRGAICSWRKVGTRLAQAISKVALAGVAEVEGGRLRRLGLGMASVAPVTALLPTVRALGLTSPLDTIDAAALEEAVGKDIAPIDDIRSTAAYRRHVALALVRNFFRELGAPIGR